MTDPLNSEPRIWMNVTTSANWNRPAVGIVRVEQELFKALSAALGERLRPCVLRDGQLVPYSGPIGSIKSTGGQSDQKSFMWPDPSYDFPSLGSLDPKPIAAPTTVARRPLRVPRVQQDRIEFGDVLISVGLDWDWQAQRLDLILHELKSKRGVRVITCCYDLIPVLFPQYCVGDVAAKFREYFTNVTWASSGMLCISKRSEADYLALANELGMPSIPTKVMLLGNKLPEGGDDVSEAVKTISEGRFLLFVSTIERRKNHDVLYKALHILADRRRLDPELKLVFVGMPGWGVNDLLKDIDLDPLVRDHIVQLHHTNDAELRLLYESCDFFLYPSFYEGWGLPVAEALALGKFVIASDRGSIPEVGGDLVQYADPWNASEWANLIDKYWSQPQLVADRAAKIQNAYHPIHWDETAGAVLELIEEMGPPPPKKFAFRPGYDMQTMAGVPFGPKIVLAEAKGLLSYGPYHPLPRGRATVRVEIERIQPEPVNLLFKFTANKGKKVISKERRVLNGKKLNSKLEFKIDLRDEIENFEVAIEVNDETSLSLNSMTIDFDDKAK